MKIKRTYSFAYWTASFITLFIIATLLISAYLFLDVTLNITYLLTFTAVVFCFTFIIIQYRLEKFIYKRIKKIYDRVSVLDRSDFNKTAITSDIDALSREVQKFAEFNQEQIASLNLRENYRREFKSFKP